MHTTYLSERLWIVRDEAQRIAAFQRTETRSVMDSFVRRQTSLFDMADCSSASRSLTTEGGSTTSIRAAPTSFSSVERFISGAYCNAIASACVRMRELWVHICV